MELTTKFNIFYARYGGGMNLTPSVYVIDSITTKNNGSLGDTSGPKHQIVYGLLESRKRDGKELDEEGLQRAIEDKKLFTNIKDYKKAALVILRKDIEYFREAEKNLLKNKLENILRGNDK